MIMKNVFISVLLSLISIYGFSQQSSVFENLSKAFNANNPTEISQYFAGNIDLSIDNNEGTFSKQQASRILEDFFNKNKVISFKTGHSGSSNDRTQYSIAKLKTSKNVWSVYILINSESKITQLQIEQE